MAPPGAGAGVWIDGKQYNVVQDHETYVVSDVPAHPDSDSRMERRVHYDSFLKGYLKRRSAANPLDQSIYCVDTETEILTDEGWKQYDTLQIGDRVFTLNHETGLSEWQFCEAVNIFPEKKREMLSLESLNHSSLTTLDHRWPVLDSLSRNWVTSSELNATHKLITNLGDLAVSTLNHKKVFYNGKVWCPTTRNGSWFARRNGKRYFTGNSMNIYNRIEKAGEGLWFSWGGDTRMGDRIFGQRLVSTSQTPASAPILFGDGPTYSYVICKQHVYAITGIVNGVQQISLSRDFSTDSPTVQIVDAISFNGRLYVATVQLTNGVPDYSKPQVEWVWDQSTITTNWTHPPSPLPAVTFPAGASTTLAAALGTSGSPMTVGSTTGMPASPTTFDITVDSEIINVTTASSTTLTVNTRGRFGSPTAAHQTGATVTYNPAVAVAGTAGQIRWQYWVDTTLAGQDAVPSATQTVLTGAATLTATNYNTITFNTVSGQTYSVFRAYAGGSPNSVGLIATGIAGTGSPVAFNDTGLSVSSLHYQITPQFAIGDSGMASSFAVIRNTLWRAAGAKMWAWDGQQATWSGESVIGDPNTNITGLDVYQDGLVIFKQDGIYNLNRSGDVFPLFPGFRTLGFNPRPIGQWQGQYYFASDVGMIWEWNGDTINSIGFDYAEAYPFPDGTFGLPNAATRGIQMPNYLLVGFNKFNSNNNASFFLAWDGNGWHPFHYDPNYQASGLGLTGGNQFPVNPTIQFGKVTWNNVAWNINYLTQPTLDPYLVTSYDTITQTIFLPVDAGIIADEWKVLEGIRIFVENPTVGIVRISYCTDDNIFTQTYVDFPVPQNDRTTIQTFLPSGTLPVYRKIMFKVTLTPDASGATPIVRSIMHRYKQRESQRKSWKMQLLLEEGQMMPNRNKEGRTSQDMLGDLNAARKNRNLVVFKDLVSDTYQVYVESVGESLKTYRGRNMQTTFIAEVILVEPAEVSNF